MSTILVTGSKGFIAGYLIEELLKNGHKVIGVDNLSKYGDLEKSYDTHENYAFVKGDAKDTTLLKDLLVDYRCDHFAMLAAMIGGISYFHEFAYDLLSENEKITASSFDAAIFAFKKNTLKKVTSLSSSMVFENALEFPTKEGHQHQCPPPSSTYGFQKLATEYFAKGAFEQYALPYTIVRPFNCVGTGEYRAKCDVNIMSGNIKLAMSHVVPDICQKILKGQDPLHILGNGNQVRHYTYGGDLAKGISTCIFHPNALNNDFNISTSVSTTVLELAQLIWNKIHGNTKKFSYVSDEAFKYDVQLRVPTTDKAKTLLNYTADTTLDMALNEIIPWVKTQVELGNI
jgi:UDP-glucose 4-epimerase